MKYYYEEITGFIKKVQLVIDFDKIEKKYIVFVIPMVWRTYIEYNHWGARKKFDYH